MIELTCERCGRTVSVADKQAGREGKCPACGQMLSILGGGPPAAPQAPIPLPVAAAPAGPAPPPPAAATPTGPAASSPLATAAMLIGIAVLVLLIGSTIWRIVDFARTKEFGLGPLSVVEVLVRFGGCVIGVILGIVAAVKIHGSGGRLKGTGKAVTGIVLCGATLLLSLLAGLVLAVALPSVAQAQDRVSAARAMANIRNLCEAATTHAMDQNGRLPAADTFPQALAPYVGREIDELLCDPANRSAGRAFAMNARLSGVSMSAVETPHATVLFFECEFGSPCAGTREHLPLTPRRRRGYIVCFVDGHVEQVPPEEVEDLIWDPRGR